MNRTVATKSSNEVVCRLPGPAPFDNRHSAYKACEAIDVFPESAFLGVSVVHVSTRTDWGKHEIWVNLQKKSKLQITNLESFRQVAILPVYPIATGDHKHFFSMKMVSCKFEEQLQKKPKR